MRPGTNSKSELSVEQLLLELKSRDVRIWLEGGRLRVNAPRDGLSSELRGTLADRKLEIIGFMERASLGEGAPIVRRAEVGVDLPLSFDQQRTWFLHQLNPQGLVFNLQTSLLVRAAPDDVERAWNAALERHAVLRTTYHSGAEGPTQRIAPFERVSLPVLDLAALDDTAARSRILAASRDAFQQTFDLAQGPVWRVVAFQMRSQVVVLVSIHHIATDGWSLDRLKRELSELCEARACGHEPNLPPLPIQYADFVLWQREWLQGDVLESQLAYWRQRLSGLPHALELPADYPRPAIQTGTGATVTAALPVRTCEGLRALAQRHRVTPFMLLLALFKVLLWRNSGQFDVVVGTPISGRVRPELENVQGLFLNSLVLRTHLGGNPTFSELLVRVRESALGAFAHQSLPFQMLVDDLRPQRDLSRNPIFQAMFNMLIWQSDSLATIGGEAGIGAAVDLESSVQVDLALQVFEADDTLGLLFSFDTDLFLASTITRWAGQYLRLAEAVVADDQARIGALELSGEREREKVLFEWNETRQEVPAEPVTRLFERHARNRPEAMALEFEGQELSYRELNARANRLARRLRAAGVGRETKVGVFLERGVEMVVAVLAVMKARGAYVPLDPAYPRERLEFMLGDSQARVLLSQERLLGAIDCSQVSVVSVDGHAQAIATEEAGDLEEASQGCELAYVIYTSGSTGRPKGVQIEHGSLTNFVCSMARCPGAGADDVLVAVTTLSFDIAGLELYLPLTVGARVVLASRETAGDGAALARLLEQAGATLLQATPATWRLLLAAGWKGGSKLKALCGGEAMSRELAEQLLGCCGELWNLYGPTETTIWSAACRVEAGRGAVPIGRPIANTQLYVLDERREPVPIGVPGDLHIGGAGVARGYWARDELTAERFVSDPFGIGGRLYCTGDRARYLENGNLEYLGRDDAQVKLRGFRIELGEIESVLARVSGVAAAVAAVREVRPGDQRLVGYVVQSGAVPVPVEHLREAAARELPAYMVPTAWVFLETLPLTPNGKIDRNALPGSGFESRSDRRYVAPATPGERALAAIWGEALGIDRVGIHDNFFDIGGHSLLAMQTLVRFKEQTGYSLAPQNFYLQTLGQLAASVEGDVAAAARSASPAMLDLEPFFFGSEARPLFGLIRRARTPRGVGVVVCPPHAHEYVRTHRALRELGQRLAQSGVDVMSFDYYGTGDSGGEYEEGGIEGWKLDVATAIDAMKQKLHLESICLVGLRLGATIAMTVGCGRGDVRAMALWDPVVQGSDIEAEIAEIETLQALDPVRQHDITHSDVLAYPLTPSMAADLAQIDLFSQTPSRAASMLVLETTAQGGGLRLVDLARVQGARADHRYIEEAKVWKREPYQAIVPRESTRTLLSWIEGNVQ